jgi:hypothetical protein
MDKEKIKEIILNAIHNVNLEDEDLRVIEFSDKLSDDIIKYNNSIKYRKFVCNKETFKWELQECR